MRPEGAGIRGNIAAAPVSAEVLAAAQRALVTDLVPQLGALRQFVVLNYTAVVKARRGPRLLRLLPPRANLGVSAPR